VSARARGRRVSSLLPAVCALFAACASPPPAPPPIEVEYGGCRALLEPGPLCILDESGEMHLWVGARPEDEVEVAIDGRRLDVASKSVGGGRQLPLTLSAGAQRIDLEVAGRRVFSLAVAAASEDGPSRNANGDDGKSRDVMGEVTATARKVHGAVRDRDLATAREALAGVQLSAQPPAESRYLLSYYRGLLAEQEGDYRTALHEVRAAVQIAERAGVERYRRLAEEELALLLRRIGRSREAAAIFERLRASLDDRRYCEEEPQLLHNQAWTALLAREAGERLADPTELLSSALKMYESCAAATSARKANTKINLALAHLQAGRLVAAKRLLREARAAEPHPPLLHLLWLLDLEARLVAREGDPRRALELFAELERRAVDSTSADAVLRAALGKAQAQRALGQTDVASAILRDAEALLDEQSLQVPMQEGRESFLAARQAIVDLHLDLLLTGGHAREALQVALRARSRVLRQLAQADRFSGLNAEARTQRGRLIGEYHRRRTALEARASNEWKLPADRLDHERAARRAEGEALERLLDEVYRLLGEAPHGPGSAPAAAQPSAAQAGELTLVYHPTAAGWVAFAADEGGVVADRFELASPLQATAEALAAKLLLPFRAAIERAKRVRVVASGSLENVDIHALPLGGDPLLAARPVVYGLGLPSSRRPSSNRDRLALLVTDPRGDLPGALDESRRIRGVLEDRDTPWRTVELRGVDASVEAVRGRLAAADLLHYAGHGSYSGSGGWESSLLLAGDTRLTVGDLLALDRVPPWVVLSGCDTGRSAGDASVASLGLAQAFLLAGSRAVVASTTPTVDRQAPAFFAELYRQWDREPDLALAMQRAQLASRERSGRRDWSSFRLLQP
jgi:cellulose synthase operon protein C